jgi:hypothetical protein
MPVLDEVIFVDGGQTFGEIRKIRQELEILKKSLRDLKTIGEKQEKIQAKANEVIDKRKELIGLYQKRLERRLIGQTDCLTKKSPFVKATMTAIGLETIGEIFYQQASDDMPSFVHAIQDLDSAFKNIPEQGFIDGAKITYPELPIDKIPSYGHFLYRYFRNSMIHGFWGRAVFLSYEDCDHFKIKDGYMVLNPDGFWELFKKLFHKLFQKVLTSDVLDDSMVNNCMLRLDKTIRFLNEE